MKKGIDISHWQGQNFDFTKAKDNGYEWACLKAGGGSDHHNRYTDVCFYTNYKNATYAGISHISAYYYGHDKSVNSAIMSARYFYDVIKDLPVHSYLFYDVEGEMLSLSKTDLTTIISAFCEELNALCGKDVSGIYTSESHFNNLIFDDLLSHLPHWVAKYSESEPHLNSGNKVDIWQYSSASNDLWGFPVDVNKVYSDLPNFYNGLTFDMVVENTYKGMYGNGRSNRKQMVEALGFDYDEVQKAVNERYYGISNNANTQTPTPGKKTVEEMAALVYRGDFGNGAVRKAQVEALGYNYDEVQSAVNRIYYGITE